MKTVLIVEDNTELCNFYSRVIEYLGVRPVEAFSCRDALNYLRREPPQLILLDMGLPDGTGESIINFVRAQAELSLIRIAILTGDSDYKKWATGMAVDAFLVKPIFSPALLDVVGRFTM